MSVYRTIGPLVLCVVVYCLSVVCLIINRLFSLKKRKCMAYKKKWQFLFDFIDILESDSAKI